MKKTEKIDLLKCYINYIFLEGKRNGKIHLREAMKA
jgi:hypothetical protein